MLLPHRAWEVMVPAAVMDLATVPIVVSGPAASGLRRRRLLHLRLRHTDLTPHLLTALVPLTGEVQAIMTVLPVRQLFIITFSRFNLKYNLFPMCDRMCSFFRCSGSFLHAYCYQWEYGYLRFWCYHHGNRRTNPGSTSLRSFRCECVSR